MTGGPKAERVRRVTSASDGPVEVGWVPEHSAPTVKDRPLVMLQTLSQRDGRPLFRLTFDEAEAWELHASLGYVLGAELMGLSIWRNAILHAIAAVERDYLDKRVTDPFVERIRALIGEEPKVEVVHPEVKPRSLDPLSLEATMTTEELATLAHVAERAARSAPTSRSVLTAILEHQLTQLGLIVQVDGEASPLVLYYEPTDRGRKVLDLPRGERAMNVVDTSGYTFDTSIPAAGGGGGGAGQPTGGTGTSGRPWPCAHPVTLDRKEYGVLVKRTCGACGEVLTGTVGSSGSVGSPSKPEEMFAEEEGSPPRTIHDCLAKLESIQSHLSIVRGVTSTQLPGNSAHWDAVDSLAWTVRALATVVTSLVDGLRVTGWLNLPTRGEVAVAARGALGGHCGSRNCLRGSSAGDKTTALLDPGTFRPSGCECTCGDCRTAIHNREVSK